MPTRAEEDLAAWRAWNENKSEATLVPLMERFQGMVNDRVNVFRGAHVPQAAVRAAGNRLLLQAFATYDPDKGAALHTWTHHYLQKVRGVVNEYQNVGSITEKRSGRITEYKEAVEELQLKRGFPPSAADIAEHMKVPVAEVKRLERATRPSLITSLSFDEDLAETGRNDRERDLMLNMVYEMTPDERTVYEYSLGINGRPKLSATAIAQVMGITKTQVSRIRNSYIKRLEKRGL